MKKRLLSAFMALALCLTLLPTAALAAEADAPEGGTIVQEEQQENAPAAESPAILEQAADAVAEVDGTTYSDLIAAFDEAQEKTSATVKLLADVATNGRTSSTHGDYGNGYYVFDQGNVTFDLNGHTLTWTKYDVYRTSLVVGDNGRLTIRDSGTGGKIYNEETQALQIYAGTLNIQSGTVVSESNKALKIIGGDVSITGGTIHSGHYSGEGVSISPDTVNNRTATLTISGGAELKGGTNGSGLYVNHVGDENPLVKLSGGTYTGGSSGINCHNTTVGTLLDENCRYMLSGSEVTDTGVAALGSGVMVEADPNAPVEYIDADGNPAKHTNCTEITAETAKLTDSWYVVKENVTINGDLPVTGSEDVNLILCDGATLTISDALTVENDAVLNLYFQSNGTGKLTVGNSTGTVTAPAGEMKKTTGDSSTTFEKCKDHLWTYTNNGENHTTRCNLCGKDGGAVNHSYTGWTDNGDGTHTGTCACGATKTENHTLTCTPNADGLTHSTKCSVCGYAAAAENHNFDQTDEYGKKCECGAYLAAEYNGQQYATLARAIEAAKNGGTVMLQMDVGERITVNDGMNVTIDLKNNGWTTDGNIAHATLVVTGGSVTVQNGELTSGTSSNAYTAVEVEGGKLTVGENMTIQGGSMDADRQFPAIDVKGGELVLSVGATLNGGMKVSVEDKHLSDYLPEGTAFGLRSYDKATGTWAEDKDLFAGAYTTNAYNVPDMALVVVEHKHTFAAGTTNCECGFTCAQHDWSKKNGVCTVCGSACPHNAGAAEADGVWACNTCGQTVTAMVTAPGGAITYYADGYVNNNVKSGLYFAVQAAESGSTVTMLGGGCMAGCFVRGGITLTLDVSNGKTIDGTLNVGYTNPDDKGNTLIVRGSAEISYVIVDPGNTLDLTGWTGRIGSLTVLNGGNATLNGGTFEKLTVRGAAAGSLLASGYAFQYVDSGAYVECSTTDTIENVKVVKCPHSDVTPKADLTGVKCKYCGASFAATLDDAPYGTINDAVSAWLQKGGTLKLYANYTAADGTWSIGSESHTINLNGYRMSVQDDSAFKPTNNMHLTVTDGTERGQIDNILLDGNQGGSFTLESGYVGNLEMTGGAVVALKGGSVDKLDVRDWSENTRISITGGSLGAYKLPSGKILADVLDHQYYATGTSLDRQEDTAQSWEKFVIKKAPYDFESTSKAANVPINGSITFRVDSPSENVGVYDVKWYRRTNSGAEHMVENRVADVNVNDKLDVFCVITGLDRPNGAMQWQVAVKGYKLTVTKADLSQGAVVFTQTAEEFAGTMGNIGDGKGTFVFEPYGGNADSPTKLSYLFKVTYNGQPLKLDKDYTIKDSSNRASNAGTHTLTIEGMGDYKGTATHTWRIEPYKLTRGNYRPPTITKVYDGTTGFDFSKAGNWGIFTENVANRPNDAGTGKNPVLGADETAISIYLKPEDLKASAVTLDSPDVGDRTASYTITLKTRDGQREPNFVFEDGEPPTIQVTAPAYITKAFLSSSPEAGELNVANDHAGVYTLDLAALLPALEAPREYGAVTYGAPAVNLPSGYYAVGTARIENGKLILPIQAVETKETGSIGSVQVKVSATNYHEFTLTIDVNATNKIVPTGEPTLSMETLTYGQALSAIKLSGKLHDNVNNKDIGGTFTWADGTIKPGAGSNEAMWKFTPTDGDTYAETTGTVIITVNKAKPTGDPIYTKITAANKTLKDAALKPNTSWPTGTIQWVDKDGKALPDTTEVKANTAYKWIFTPDAELAANYTTATGELTLYSVSTGGGGGGSSSGSTVKTDTVTNPDGSVTKTETKKDGTVIETTTGKDGSVSKTETKKDGSSVTETKAADGSTGTVKTDKNGQTTAETTLSSKAIEDAKKSGEPVKAPVEVKASRDSSTAPTVKIELPRNSGDTKVEIPVTNVKPGTVAVIVHPDGTEEIVKNSLPTEDGIQLTVNGGATVKIVDNSKDFIDTRNHWAKDAIDFVSARGLVNGMNDSIYAPNNSTTRAQLWTILARQNDADLNGGNTWYEKAQLWSKNKGISDGANPNGTINRAQMVTMLWRAEGQPAAGGAATFTDVSADSYYAQAVAWAIENGITTGVGGGRFDPSATCTRAQIATFLYRLYLSR